MDSRPSRARGLKRSMKNIINKKTVFASITGAWIETFKDSFIGLVPRFRVHHGRVD